jgi:flagellar M-ring protein FliF
VASNVPGYVATGGAPGESEYEKQEITRNYEISVSEKYQVKAPGELRKLSVAVWVDGELAEDDREQLVTMVSSAVGLRPERGDVVQIGSMPFAADLAAPVSGSDDMTRLGLGDWRLLILVPLLIILLLVVMARRRKPVPDEGIESLAAVAEEDETEIPDRPLTPEEQQRLRIRRQVERMAEEDPEGLSRLLRAWMTED